MEEIKNKRSHSKKVLVYIPKDFFVGWTYNFIKQKFLKDLYKINFT